MGNAENPPDSKKKLKRKKTPRGQKAVGHRIEVEYDEPDGNGTKWHKGKIIMYNKSRGYCVRFDDCSPNDDQWEKKINGDDIRFLS